MVIEQEARDMEIAINAFHQKDFDIIKAQRQANLAIAITWYDTLGINIQTSTTRTKALSNFNQIKSLIETETDRYRISVLFTKLKEANIKYTAVKKVNPNS